VKRAARTRAVRRVLVVDIGGTNVKLLATGQTEPRRFPSGPTLTPRKMVAGVRRAATGWPYDVIAIGYPGPVAGGHPITEASNLAPGWVGFDFQVAFGCPVKLRNDAAMQALGSYAGGTMLFLGLGTGLGTALVADGVVEHLELGYLPYKKGTYEDYVGRRGLKRLGRKKWRANVREMVERLAGAIKPDEVVIGGGNVKKLGDLPPRCRAGSNANAFVGGFRLWERDGA